MFALLTRFEVASTEVLEMVKNWMLDNDYQLEKSKEDRFRVILKENEESEATITMKVVLRKVIDGRYSIEFMRVEGDSFYFY